MSAYLPPAPADTGHQYRTPSHCVCIPPSYSCQYWASTYNTRPLCLHTSLLPILGINIQHQASVSAYLPPAPANTRHPCRTPGHCVCLPTSCSCQYWASTYNTRPLCLHTSLLSILGINIQHQATVSAYLPPAPANTKH